MDANNLTEGLPEHGQGIVNKFFFCDNWREYRGVFSGVGL
jgi:hypothetical protein